MQRAEFDTWVEAHYPEFFKVARRRTNSAQDAQDVVQHAIVSALTTRWYERSTKPWSRMTLAIRGAARDFRERSANFISARNDFRYASTPTNGRRRLAPRAE